MEKTTMLGLCLTFIILAHCISVESSVTLDFKFLRYSNRFHQLKGGYCCDNMWGSCDDYCDNRFSVCIDASPAGWNSMKDCSVSSLSAGTFWDNDNITFTSDVISKALDKWTGWLEVRFQVWDFDQANADDLVDDDSISLALPIYKSKSKAQMSEYTLGTKSAFTFGISVYCDDGYYGPDCSVFCHQRDHPTYGHYTCHSLTGAKICNSGWIGEKCDIAVTTPQVVPTTTEPTPTARDLPLAGKPVYQSSMMTDCDGSTFPAHSATDGDILTFSSTSNVSGRSPWWLVDLEVEYCLSKIIVLLPQDSGSYQIEPSFAGAVARAGGHYFYALNEPCGHPATKEESRRSGGIIFQCDPPLRARYVSLDIDRFHPGDAVPILQIAEINIKESLDPNCGHPSG